MSSANAGGTAVRNTGLSVPTYYALFSEFWCDNLSNEEVAGYSWLHHSVSVTLYLFRYMEFKLLLITTVDNKVDCHSLMFLSIGPI